MIRILHPLLALLACSTRPELTCLKNVNRILRARLPERLATTQQERRRLLRVWGDGSIATPQQPANAALVAIIDGSARTLPTAAERPSELMAGLLAGFLPSQVYRTIVNAAVGSCGYIPGTNGFRH